MSDPRVSIIIPVHQEAAILVSAVRDLCAQLIDCEFSYELCLAENGSSDNTAELARELSEAHEAVSTFSLAEANYGAALRAGILRARGEIVICDEIDLCDVEFHAQAVTLLGEGKIDMVIGSKLLAGARDERPLFRHMASQTYSTLLRLLLGFRGTDTHGLKAFRRSAVAPVAERCVVDRNVFASELVIRAYREGLEVCEVPVQLHEKRPPSVDLIRRVPHVVMNLVRLVRAIGLR